MCWSALVSWRFACLDTLFVALLVARSFQKPNPTFARTYAALMSSIALQEWGQYILWRRQLSCYSMADAALGFWTTGAAESVPLPLLVCSYYTVRSVPHYQRIRRAAIALWFFQFVVILGSIAVTRKYCVEHGERGHQVWICESATHAAGGRFLHDLFYWLYVTSCLLSAESVDLPRGERLRLQVIPLISAVGCFVMYGHTLEACSVWCFSAFTVGMSLVAEVYGYTDRILRYISTIVDHYLHHPELLRATGKKLARSMVYDYDPRSSSSSSRHSRLSQ